MATRNIRSNLDNKKVARLLENIVTQQLAANENTLFRNGDEITAFGDYKIIKHDQHFQIFKKQEHIIDTAYIKTALSWCVADKFNLYQLKRDLIQHDISVSKHANDIIFYKHIIKRSVDSNHKTTVLARLSNTIGEINSAKIRLNKCINSAKYWQQKGFENETSRLGNT